MERQVRIQSILTIGITPDLSTNLASKIRLVNLMAATATFFSLFFAFYFGLFQSLRLSFWISLLVPICLAPILFNYAHRYQAGIQVLLISGGINLTTLSGLFGPDLQAHLFFMHMVALTAYLLRDSKWKYAYYAYYLVMVLTSISFYEADIQLFPYESAPGTYSAIFLIAVGTLGLYLHNFNRIINVNEQEVNRLLLEAQEKNLALEEAQKNAEDLNETLEKQVQDRTYELEISNQELRRSNQDLEQFAYAASHDLQEPLRMISNFSRLLEKRLSAQLDEDTRTYMDFIVDSVKRMSGLIKGLLTYSRVGRKESDFEPTNIRSLVARQLNDYGPLIEEKQADIELGDLPDELVCEPQQIGILFSNLIHNALKFCIEKPKITIQSMEEGPNWVFMISDNGIGIPTEYQDQVFEIFRRLHHRDQYSGTGIGLSLSRKIVDRHGGEIWLNSKEGKGTTFFFRLPKIATPVSLVQQAAY